MTASVIDFPTLIKVHLENPTHEMSVAFSRLPAAHKWMLFSLLEVAESSQFKRFASASDEARPLKTHYEELCPEADFQSFDTILNELSEGFLTSKKTFLEDGLIDWIHPSCRDLTIDALASNQAWRRHFLSKCYEPGIQLAASVGGGAFGKRFMPLLQTSRDWATFSERCVQLQSQALSIAPQIWLIYTYLPEDGSENSSRAKLKAVIDLVWPIYEKQNISRDYWAITDLKIFLEMRSQIGSAEEFSGLMVFFENIKSDLEYSLDERRPIIEAGSDIRKFVAAVNLVTSKMSSTLLSEELQTCIEESIELLSDRGQSEIDTHYFRDDLKMDQLENEAEGYRDLQTAFSGLASITKSSPIQSWFFSSCSRHFSSEISSIEDQIENKRNRESDKLENLLNEVREDSHHITLTRLFSDL